MDKNTFKTNTDIPSSSSNYSSIFSNSEINSGSGSSSGSSSGFGSDSINSFWDRIKNFPFLTWVIIILILALLGFNIFFYLGEATQDITDFFKPIIIKIYQILGLTTKNIVNVGLEDSRTLVNKTANVYDKTTTAIQNKINSSSLLPSSTSTSVPSFTAKTSLSNDTFPEKKLSNDVSESNTLNKALNTSTAVKAGASTTDYEADESSSTIQRGAASKSGWCFIGEDRGFRTCAQVGVNDTCMSGDIFPSNEICINPTLRP